MITILALGMILSTAAGAEPLRWGADKTGGAPYVYEADDKLIGFEVELADYLASQLGRTPELVNVMWDNLPDALLNRRIDIVLNGYEFDPKRNEETPCSLPYYVYSLRLIVRSGEKDIRNWADLIPGPGKPQRIVLALRGSASQRYLEEKGIEVQTSEDVDTMLRRLETDKAIAASVQDNPAAVYYVEQKPLGDLKLVGEPAGFGLYCILMRKEDKQLREQIDETLRKARRNGKLKQILEKYGLWNDDQSRLEPYYGVWPPGKAEGDEDAAPEAIAGPKAAGSSLWGLREKLLDATCVTLELTFLAMPLAVFLGIAIAAGRLYGPLLLGIPMTVYVELIRGTPIILQMFFWFFIAPQIPAALGWQWLTDQLTGIGPFYYGIFGLALNYGAYEAENFRAGLQSVPRGQVEAALALGIPPSKVFFRIVLPQAFRTVIPPVTNDFISLLKDTSICSMIMVTELTNIYYQYKWNRAIALELSLTVAVIYLCLSYPLSLMAARLEKRLRRGEG